MTECPDNSRTDPNQRNSDFRWTVMVLMGVNTPPSERDLSREAEEQLAGIGTIEDLATSPYLNLFVQYHGRSGAARQHIAHGPAERVDVDAESATDGSALLSFMDWAYDTAKHRPDKDRLLLVLWGHSYDFAISRTQTRTGVDGLDFAELGGILRRFTDRRKKTIDIVGFDACGVATVEMAYELHDVADYLLASQMGIPLPGWPYGRIFQRVAVPEGNLMGPAELGSYIVRRYCETYHAEDTTVSLTMQDLGRAPALVEKTEALARRLAIAVEGDRNELEVLAGFLKSAQTLDDEPFIDVADLCLTLLRECGDRQVQLAAEDLGDLLLSPGPVFRGQSLHGKGRPFIVEHGRNACETARMHGVSLYAPHVLPGHHVDAAQQFYEKFRFFKETMWADVVGAML